MKKDIRRHVEENAPAVAARTDSGPSAKTYMALVNVLGLATLAYALFQIASQPEVAWLGLAALTVITSCLAVRIRIPGGRAGGLAVTVSDCFVFIALLLYGPAAAALTAAIDGLVTCIRCLPRSA